MIATIFVLSSIGTISLGITLVCLIGHRSRQIKATLPEIPKMRASCVPCAQCTATRKNRYTDVSQQAERERRFSWQRIQVAYEEVAELEKVQ